MFKVKIHPVRSSRQNDYKFEEDQIYVNGIKYDLSEIDGFKNGDELGSEHIISVNRENNDLYVTLVYYHQTPNTHFKDLEYMSEDEFLEMLNNED